MGKNIFLIIFSITAVFALSYFLGSVSFAFNSFYSFIVAIAIAKPKLALWHTAGLGIVADIFFSTYGILTSVFLSLLALTYFFSNHLSWRNKLGLVMTVTFCLACGLIFMSLFGFIFGSIYNINFGLNALALGLTRWIWFLTFNTLLVMVLLWFNSKYFLAR